MPFSTTYANSVLNLMMGRTASLTGHKMVYLGLCTNDPEADAGVFNELSGNAYGRVLLHEYNMDHPDLMNAASARGITNKKQIGFTKASPSAWPTAKGYGLFTAETGGTPFFYAKLREPVDTPAGAVFLFDPGELKIDFQTTDVDIT